MTSEAYRRAGVDLDAAAKAVELIRELGGAASRPELVEGVGGFAGLFEIADGRFLAAATDGVGTKLEIARSSGRDAPPPSSRISSTAFAAASRSTPARR